MLGSRGCWLSDPVLELLPGSRNVRLPVSAGPLVYVDRRGQRHEVPGGWISDGLTSPAWTWSIIGSPLTPRYRRPAFLHDFHVVTQLVSHAESVRLLRETLTEGGTSSSRSTIFSLLVRLFGPSW